MFIATAMDKQGHEVICAYFGNVSKESTFASIRRLFNYTFEQYDKGNLTLTKSNYDVRYSKDLGPVYRTYASLNCFPTGDSGLFRPETAVNRKQLARMAGKIAGLDKDPVLKAFAAGNANGRVTSLRMAELVCDLFPQTAVSKEEQKEALEKCKNIKGLTKKEKAAFAAYVSLGLAPDESCLNPGQKINRGQAMIFSDMLADYRLSYEASHGDYRVAGVSEDGTIPMDQVSRSESVV